jgi:branched-chain amino acid transport system ATP-binding protein
MSLLSVRDVSKRFGGLIAVDGVSFEVHEGEILALIGPNGAGKSTLFNTLTGFDRPDSGSVEYRGRDLVGMKAHHVTRAGVARTFQNTQLFEEMTALENVLVGLYPRTRTGMLAAALRLPRTRTEERIAHEDSERLLRLVGLGDVAAMRASDLPHGSRRLLEVARALATGPTLLLLDEPAAGLNAAETSQLAKVLFEIRDSGVTIVVVEHDMGLVMEVSDEIIVLNQGIKIASGPPRLIQKDPVVIEAYLGEEDDDAAL